MITFRNPGAIDLRGLTTFGLSSKSESQIGRFGTGLKYAVSVIIRAGGSVSLYTGGAWHTVERREDEFRGSTIEQLTLDGVDLPFTSDLGKDWEPWMAFRELYSNALDEGGDVERGEERPDGSEDETLICVELDAFEAIFFTMEEHFISRDEEPIWSTDNLEVYAGRSVFVFNNGIAVHKLKEPAAYRYNIKGYINLTEDRTAKYSWQVEGAIEQALVACDHSDIAAAACDQRNAFEAKLDFSEHAKTASHAFLGATVSLGVNANPTAAAVVQAQIPDSPNTATILSKSHPGHDALSDALSVLRSIGADLSKARFVLADGIPIYGDFDVRGDAVFLSEAIFEEPDRMTVAAVEGYAEIQGNAWLARRLINLCKEATQ